MPRDTVAPSRSRVVGGIVLALPRPTATARSRPWLVTLRRALVLRPHLRRSCLTHHQDRLHFEHSFRCVWEAS